jgi:hypothetical protein
MILDSINDVGKIAEIFQEWIHAYRPCISDPFSEEWKEYKSKLEVVKRFFAENNIKRCDCIWCQWQDKYGYIIQRRRPEQQQQTNNVPIRIKGGNVTTPYGEQAT